MLDDVNPNDMMSSDIRNRLREKLADRKNRYKWSDIDLSQVQIETNLAKYGQEFITKRLKISENIAKMSIDLCTDYEYFRDFLFEGKFEDKYYEDCLRELKYNKTDNVWRSSDRPIDDVIMKNMFVYCYYLEMEKRLKVEMTRLEKQSKEENRCSAKTNEAINWKCELCETIISGEVTSCNICNTERKVTWNCPRCTCNNELSVQVCKACKFEIVEQAREFGTGRVKREERIDDQITWDCQYKSCKTKNGPKDSYCKICGIEKLNSGKYLTPVYCFENRSLLQVWVCNKCTAINKVEVNKSGKWKCNTCEMLAEDKISVPDTQNNHPIINDPSIDLPNKWECSRCQFMNEQQLITCKVCYEAKTKTWKCHKCTMKNEISNGNCGACGEKKQDPAVSGCCMNCRQQREINQEGLCVKCWNNRGTGWTCAYAKCGNKNYGDRGFCSKCGLRQFDPQNKGQVIERNSNRQLVQVWICSHCDEINDNCDEDCRECRYQRF